MNPRIDAFKAQFAPKVPEFYYNSCNMTFMFKQTVNSAKQNWIEVCERTAVSILAAAGVRTEKADGELASPASDLLLSTRMDSTKTVAYSGPIGGYMKGMHDMGTFNALVTESPRIPKPVKGDCSLIKAVIDGLFGDRGGVQLPYVYSSLKLWYEALVDGDTRGMPALIICGQKNCGKSFFQEHIVTPLLGGRSASAARYITGKTSFNADLFRAEHLMIGDEALSTATSDRINLGNTIKNLVANETQSVHGKFKDALSMRPYSRLTVSLNDEPENVMALPPFNDSVSDKLMLLKATEFEWPVFAVTYAEKREFRDMVYAQIPAFCYWLKHEYSVPLELVLDPRSGKPARFGVNCYHHPEILGILTEVSPEFRFLELLRTCFFVSPVAGDEPDTSDIRMTALEIEHGMTCEDSPVKYETRRLLTSGTRASTYLNRLHKKFPHAVYQTRSSRARTWVVSGVDEMLSSVIS